MLWVALRWNWGNTLPIAGFSLLTIITLGEGWSTNPAITSPLPQMQSESIVSSSDSLADVRQPAAAIALDAN
jgi:hypothetical protein